MALPSCITHAVWRDDRTHAAQTLAAIAREGEQADDTPALLASRQKGAQGTLVVAIPAAAATRLHELLPQLPAGRHWLTLQPREHAHTIDVLTALATTTMAPRLAVEVVNDPDDQPPFVAITCAQAWVRGNPAIAELPGFDSNWDVFWTATLQARCDATATIEPPRELAESLCSLTLYDVRVDDDGTSTLAKVAQTPLAVLADLLLSPFELWWLIVR